jgi:hypothetical protein
MSSRDQEMIRLCTRYTSNQDDTQTRKSVELAYDTKQSRPILLQENHYEEQLSDRVSRYFRYCQNQKAIKESLSVSSQQA